MSAYRKIKTQFTNRQHLRAALQAAGVEFEEVPFGQVEKHLVGYHGDTRPETATFIVRRSQISYSSNDIGWHWNGSAFEEIVSDYDSSLKACNDIRHAVKREYAVSFATAQARAKGFQVKRVDQPGGAVQLVVTGRM